jgi:hypothetical protein
MLVVEVEEVISQVEEADTFCRAAKAAAAVSVVI